MWRFNQKSVMWTLPPVSNVDPRSQLSVMWTLPPVSNVDLLTCQYSKPSLLSVQWPLPFVSKWTLPPVGNVDPSTYQYIRPSHLSIQGNLPVAHPELCTIMTFVSLCVMWMLRDHGEYWYQFNCRSIQGKLHLQKGAPAWLLIIDNFVILDTGETCQWNYYSWPPQWSVASPKGCKCMQCHAQ